MSTTQQLEAALSGRYQLEREIGAGGMATVYLARDLRHDRHVALKVLRPELSAILGAERFLKEIRTTANLQHPHILPLHDSGEANGLVFYVMPFVDGESLRDRLRREMQLPVDEAVRIAREVASALDYAHRRGVVHRDIKPENILLHDGQALVADFGIALAVNAVGGGTRLTETGMSLGTPHYMSPEQAMGERDISARSDVYALGCVLYEMLVGEPPFTGPTAQAIVARVMTEEPRSPSAQRRTVPAHVDAAVLTALAKLPADRFATAAEFAAALSTPGYTSGRTVAAASPGSMPIRRWITDRRTLATLAGAAVLALLPFVRPQARGAHDPGDAVTRLRLVLDDSVDMRSYQAVLHGPPAVAPDGRTVAYAVAERDTVVLRVQSLDRFDPWVVAGGGRMPFFSPDGRWIGFLRGGSVWKVPVSGGDAIRLGSVAAEAATWELYLPGVWLPDGQLYFVGPRGVITLPASGGSARTLVIGDATAGGDEVFDLSRTPDGRLLAALTHDRRLRLALLSADGRDVQPFADDVQPPAAFVGDILVFTREGQRYASAVDLGGPRLVGEPLPLTEGLPSSRVVAQWSSGTTAAAWFVEARGRALEPVWVDRSGRAMPVGIPAADIRWPRLSPDGRRLGLWTGGDAQLLTVADLATGRRTRVRWTERATEPVWFHDGRRIVTSLQAGKSMYGLLVQMADGSREPDTLITSSRHGSWPTDVSAGDSLVLFYGKTDDDPHDVHVLHVGSKLVRRIPLPGEQRGARFSPDMRWIALESREGGGRSDVVVLPWPSLDAQHLVAEGGEEPAWSHDGRELYFRNGGRLMAVRVAPGATWSASTPGELFRGPYASDLYGDQSYDVAPDGRFLMLRYAGHARLRIHVIQNWAAELQRKLAEAK